MAGLAWASGPNFNDTDNKTASLANPLFTGNVGIGTTSPTAQLQVYDASAVWSLVSYRATYVSQFRVDGNGIFWEFGTPGTPNAYLSLDSSSSMNSFHTKSQHLSFYSNAITYASGGIMFMYYTTGCVGIANTAPASILEIQKRGTTSPFLISSAGGTPGDYLTVTSAGNVGIGSTDPEYKLVAASVNVTGNVIVGNKIFVPGNKFVVGDNAQFVFGQNAFWNPSMGWNSADSTLRIVKAENLTANVWAAFKNGNVGLGTVDPGATLDIHQVGTTKPLAVSSSNTTDGDYLVVATNGNVGLGSTLPQQKLVVTGHVKVSGQVSLPGTVALSDASGTIAVDWNNGSKQYVTLTGAGRIVTFAKPVEGANYTLVLIQGGGGNTVIAWPIIAWASGYAPVAFAGVAGHADVVKCMYVNSAYFCVMTKDFY